MILTNESLIKYTQSITNEIKCQRCGNKDSSMIKLHEKRNDLNIYKCHHCNRTFSILSNTFMSRSNFKWEAWVDMLNHLLLEYSVAESTSILKKTHKLKSLNYKTVWNWRMKILEEIQKQDDVILKGSVQIGYKKIPISNKGSNNEIDGDYCYIVCMIDENNNAAGFIDFNSDNKKIIEYFENKGTLINIVSSDDSEIFKNYFSKFRVPHYILPKDYREILIDNGYSSTILNNGSEEENRKHTNYEILEKLYDEKLIDHILNVKELSFKEFLQIKNQYSLGLYRVYSLFNYIFQSNFINTSMQTVNSSYLEKYLSLVVYKHNFRNHENYYPNRRVDAEIILTQLFLANNDIHLTYDEIRETQKDYLVRKQ